MPTFARGSRRAWPGSSRASSRGRAERTGAVFDPATGRLLLSRIFAWFEADFASRGGVLAFLLPRLPEEIRASAAARPDAVRVEYFDYDWRLNDLVRTEGP
jgi:hypothetical protein